MFFCLVCSLVAHPHSWLRKPSTVYCQGIQDHGHRVVSKTANRFSAMPIDQAHEQNNLMVKRSGGVVGLTENPAAFRKWMIAGPEQVQIIKYFMTQYSPDIPVKHYHHEENFLHKKCSNSKFSHLFKHFMIWGIPFLKHLLSY